MNAYTMHILMHSNEARVLLGVSASMNNVLVDIKQFTFVTTRWRHCK